MAGAATRENAAGALNALRAAAGNDVRVRLDDQGVVAFVEAAPGRTIPVPGAPAPAARERAAAFVRVYAPLFGLRSDADVIVTRVAERDEAGMEHVRMTQVVNGVPVTGSSLSVHLRDDGIVRIFSKTVPDAELVSTRPDLPPAAALHAAAGVVAKYFRMENATLSQPRLEILHKAVLDPRDRRPPALAWFIEARKPGVLRELIWIDARRGAKLLHFSQLAHAKNRRVYDAQHLSDLPGVLVRVEGASPTADVDVNNAYDFSGHTYDYFSSQHGRNSYDGAGASLTSSVNYCENGCPYVNAYWDGNQVVYGDDFPVDDIAAHEWTHAVTDFSAGLFYYMQSGALNESFSDIFGEAVDQTNGAGSDDPADRWLVGEDWTAGGMRDMMDPNAFGDPGRMSDPHFACWDENPQPDGGGVHSNSGVPNHAFALMVDGGSYNGYSVTAIGLTKAGKVQYRALTTYLDRASNFIDNYNALLSSCADLTGLYGISTSDCAEMRDALDAVEMDGTWGCAAAPNTPPALCSAGGPLTVAFDDLENVNSTGWSSAVVSGDDHWAYGAGASGLYWASFPQSGNWSFWGYGYDFTAQSYVRMTTPVAVTSDMRLQFAHAFAFEKFYSAAYDGGFIEYSTNGGTNWFDAGSLITAGAAYNDTIDVDGFVRSAFTGDSHGYTASQLNLGSLAGQSVLFRFHISTDYSNSDWGWFVDDIRFYRCLVVPTNVVATATAPTSVSVTWTAAAGAASYRVYRSSNGTSYTLVGSPATSSLTDTTAAANTAYLYKVRAFNGSESPDSNVDLATTVIFTDPVLTSATTQKPAHFTQLLTAVNAVRTLAGLSAVAFTAPAPALSGALRKHHVQKLRDGLHPALSDLGLPLPAYTDETIAAATPARKAHVENLRGVVR